MDLRELAWPVRLYWDLPETPDPEKALSICDEIIGIKILSISLRTNFEPASCSFILERFKGKNIAVSLSFPAHALKSGIELSELKCPLLLEAESVQGLLSVGEMPESPRFSSLGVSFRINEDNYRDIPRLVSISLEKGIRTLVFPMQRLLLEKPFYIPESEKEKIAIELEKLKFDKLQLAIHDPFIWKLFYREKEYHEQGCQAANSMLFISPEYGVYPCPAMPVELGNLKETTLSEIILSGKKKELRRALLIPPDECAGCNDLNNCHGACRGRAYAATGSFGHADPACERALKDS